MDAVVSLLRFPSSFSESKLQRPFLSLKEISDGSSAFSYQRRNIQQLSISSGKRTGNSLKDEWNKIPHSVNGEELSSSNQEEIISLFRRIKSSISKAKSASSKTRNSKSSDESVLEVLLQSRKRVTEKTSKREGDRLLIQRSGASKNDEKIDYYPTAKLTRPPSNFVKRSPIKSPARVNGKVGPGTGEVSTTTAGIQRVEEMKVSELKELAKSRGIKGYSKLKKSELLELLSK